MCSNYRPSAREEFEARYGVPPPPEPYAARVWPDGEGPIVFHASGQRVSALATFNMVPRKHETGGKHYDTYNARSETVGQRTRFRQAWQNHQFCLVPADSFFEPYYATPTAKAEWYRIWLKHDAPIAIAGIYKTWPDSEFSFSMLTVNADDHPFMRQFHKPTDEKRSVVLLPEYQWDDWLSCTSTEEARSFLTVCPAEALAAESASSSSSQPIHAN